MYVCMYVCMCMYVNMSFLHIHTWTHLHLQKLPQIIFELWRVFVLRSDQHIAAEVTCNVYWHHGGNRNFRIAEISKGLI